MAAAGVDESNVTKGEVLVLPVDPDASARRIRDGVRSLAGVNVGVVISDTFGRPWRVGVTDAAVGFAGLLAFEDLRGTVDPYGNELHVTLTCTVDEIAAAADLVKGKLNGMPVAICVDSRSCSMTKPLLRKGFPRSCGASKMTCSPSARATCCGRGSTLWSSARSPSTPSGSTARCKPPRWLPDRSGGTCCASQ